jgi:hypothetical protein
MAGSRAALLTRTCIIRILLQLTPIAYPPIFSLFLQEIF